MKSHTSSNQLTHKFISDSQLTSFFINSIMSVSPRLKRVSSGKFAFSSDAAAASRRDANYHPTVWGDYFLNHSSKFLETNENIREEHEKLGLEVRGLLVDEKMDHSNKIKLIDDIIRLGVDYHFESEINAELMKLRDHHHHLKFDLCTTSIWFRLLRAHGFSVPSDVFTKFKNTNGEFESDDARSWWCLYEATHLRTPEESILEEALKVSRKKLEALLPQLSFPLSDCVRHALHIPYYRNVPRLVARQYIPLYDAEAAKIESLARFAKIDFNMLQALHQSELKEVSRWWKDFDFATKLPYARDRISEGYYWIMGAHHEPKFSLSRKFLTKIIGITSLIDDTYDVYGNLEEVTKFTEAVERWDMEAVNDLPQYMQVIYTGLLGMYEEFKDDLINAGGRDFALYYAIEVMKEIVRSYQKEAEFFHTGYTPGFDEYMENSIISGGYKMFIILEVITRGEYSLKETLDWALTVPEMVKSSSLIARFVDDIQTYKAEEERGEDVSAVRCYMKEHGVSEEEACEKMREMIEVEWKKLNKETQETNEVTTPAVLPSLNFTRVLEVMYDEGDGYSNSQGVTKDRITALLRNPIDL
uniref:Terpene synthase 3A n=1 Tax=Daphne genkwa TaxID=1477590 RepID=A0A977LF13_9ROSI|nr:terpene synthase 3A [Daphne genkwa]